MALEFVEAGQEQAGRAPETLQDRLQRLIREEKSARALQDKLAYEQLEMARKVTMNNQEVERISREKEQTISDLHEVYSRQTQEPSKRKNGKQ